MPASTCIAPNCNQLASKDYCPRHEAEFRPPVTTCTECGEPFNVTDNGYFEAATRCADCRYGYEEWDYRYEDDY